MEQKFELNDYFEVKYNFTRIQLQRTKAPSERGKNALKLYKKIDFSQNLR